MVDESSVVEGSGMRQHILRVTAELLTQRQARLVRIADVAKAAFVAVPTIYYHFGSRVLLIGEAQDLIYQTLSAPMHDSLDRAEAAMAAGEAVAFWGVVGDHLMLAWSSGHRRDEGGVVAVLADVLANPSTRERFGLHVDATFQRWVRLLEQARDAGWVRAGVDAEALVAAFWAASVGQTMLGGRQIAAITPERMRDVFLQAVRADCPTTTT